MTSAGVFPCVERLSYNFTDLVSFEYPCTEVWID